MQPPAGSSWTEPLLGEDIKKVLQAETFNQDSVDALGYDVRLGDTVRFVTRGTEKILAVGEKIIVYPEETLLVKSEEVLDLPPDVCATGSPKMSLILNGLWAHGGKTDFGYKSQLLFGFRHHGAQPIELTRGDKIFHLSFWRVHGKPTKSAPGRVKWPPSVSPSVLDGKPALTKDLEVQVRDRDGYESYRIVRLLRSQMSRSRRTLWGVALLAAIALGAWGAAYLFPDFDKYAGGIQALTAALQILIVLILAPEVRSFLKRGGE